MLSKSTLKIIEDYLSLPFIHAKDISCPYFNNKQSGQRGQARALIGKGTPKEIVEETKIMAKKKNIDLEKLNSEETKQFLVNNNIGIECSGFVSNVLSKHYKDNNINFFKKIHIPTKNIWRKLITKIRPVENINVLTYFNERNSHEIKKLDDIKSGDLIIMLKTKKLERNHIILITDKNNDKIEYAHATRSSSEGKYNHGVRRGEIKIIDPTKNILDQIWIEKEKTNEDNETYTEAKTAKTLQIKRLKF